MKENYHTHTKRCGHASGEAEDYILAAIEAGYEILGFSEHAYQLPYLYYTMPKDEMEVYHHEIEDLKIKYKDKLQILCGLEVDYVGFMDDYCKELYQEYDYLGLSVHFFRYCEENLGRYGSGNAKTREEIFEYADLLIKGMKTGYFAYVFHPDIFVGYNDWNDSYQEASIKIIQTAIDCNLPLELNANGIRKGCIITKDNQFRYPYPRIEFWELAKSMGAKMIVGADAHNPKKLNDSALDILEVFYKDL